MATNGKLSSRKFIIWILGFIMSSALAWFKPTFVGNAQALFTFWIFMYGLYFTANVTQDTMQRKMAQGSPQNNPEK